MTAIILFEGIPTSGKSILQKKVSQILKSQNKTVELISDQEIKTPFARKNNIFDNLPIIDAPEYLQTILQEKLLKKSDFIISHNFHLFYAATNQGRNLKEALSKEYLEIETILEIHPSLIVFLEIENRYILHSFEKRIQLYDHEGLVDPFKKFLETKGTTFSQLAYYQRKQKIYNQFLKESKINSINFIIKKETDFNKLAIKIAQKIREIKGGFGR